MSLVNVSASGGRLVKNRGCDGCPDASAVSEQQISSTGTLSFVASEASTLRVVGLGSGGIGTGPGNLNFALRLQSGVAEVRESGSYRADVRFASNDRFAISVDGGVVRYSKNGAVFYTSGVRAGFAMRVHVVLFGLNGAVGSVALGGSATTSSVAPDGASATSGTRYAVPRPAGSVPRRRLKI